MDEGTMKLLALPPRLHDAGGGRRISFSSDPQTPASALSGSFFLGLPLPDKPPAYAIDLSMKGSSLYCTFVDSKRKIMVSVPVSSLAAPSADWDALGLSIRSALRGVSEAGKSGRKFAFVMVGEDTQKLI